MWIFLHFVKKDGFLRIFNTENNAIINSVHVLNKAHTHLQLIYGNLTVSAVPKSKCM